jgi:hypothetical protein
MKDHLLIFIPGIMGTELIYTGPGKFKSTITEPVWGYDISTLLKTLTTSPQRLQITTQLQAGEVLGRIRIFGINRPVYEPILSFITGSLGYIHGTDFLPFGYDWRQSNKETASSLETCRF